MGKNVRHHPKKLDGPEVVSADILSRLPPISNQTMGKLWIWEDK